MEQKYKISVIILAALAISICAVGLVLNFMVEQNAFLNIFVALIALILVTATALLVKDMARRNFDHGPEVLFNLALVAALVVLAGIISAAFIATHALVAIIPLGVQAPIALLLIRAYLGTSHS